MQQNDTQQTTKEQYYILKWLSIECFTFSGIKILYFILYWNVPGFWCALFIFSSTQNDYLLPILLFIYTYIEKVGDYHNYNFGEII